MMKPIELHASEHKASYVKEKMGRDDTERYLSQNVCSYSK